MLPALLALLWGTCPPAAAASSAPHPFLAYHDSWDERPAAAPEDTTLAALPGYMNLVALAFVKPDLVYAGNLDLSGTGLQYPFPGSVLKGAIRLLKQRHPGTRVLLSVGGASYTNWRDLDEKAVAALVRDLGADGVDIDYEPVNPDCGANGDGTVSCASDADWTDYVQRLRKALPRPAFLSVTAWSIGAYGTDAWQNATPHGQYTGVMLNLLASPQAADIDLVSIMSYDTGPMGYDPWQAFQAYRHAWKGLLAIGIEVPPSPVGGPNDTVAMAESLSRRAAADPRGGAMLYPILGTPAPPVTPDNPDGRLLGAAICRGLGLAGCGQAVP